MKAFLFAIALALGVSPFALAQSAPTTVPITAPTTAPTTAATSVPTTVPTTYTTSIPITLPTTKPTTRPTTFPTTYPTSYATTAAATPILTGPVTELASYGFNSCPPAGQSFITGYGCIPITVTASTTIVGTLAVGSIAQVYGTAVGPNVTATYVLLSAAPSATPSPVPTAAPTSTGSAGTFANAIDPAVSFAPFNGTSPFNVKVSAHPTFLANSNAIIAAQFAGSIGAVRANEAGQYDYMHPRFFATASDPVVNLVCNQYCPGSVPATMHIPAAARPAGGQDAQIFVVQPDGTEIDAWAAYGSPGSDSNWMAPHDVQTRDWQNGDTLTAGNVSTCGNYVTGSGLVNGTGATAASFCLSAGVVTGAELAAGVINHAIFVSGECAIGVQYPANGSTQQCTSGLGPPLGGREWYDVPDATTNASNLRPWEKAVLNALHDYGGYFGDNGSGGAHFTGGVAPFLESEEPYRDFAGKATYTSPFAPLASQGWASIGIPNAIGNTSGVRWFANGGSDWTPWQTLGESESQFASHIHWLAPCSAQGSC